jgi:DNA helicase-2/ATP-dependent DNA helicase PcrA
MFGFSEPADPSRFLADIPTDLLDAGSATHTLGMSRRSPVTQWKSNVVETTIHEQKFNAGTKVDHPKWGEGMILNTRIQDGDEILDIFFNSVGLKKLAASLAQLEIKD